MTRGSAITGHALNLDSHESFKEQPNPHGRGLTTLSLKVNPPKIEVTDINLARVFLPWIHSGKFLPLPSHLHQHCYHRDEQEKHILNASPIWSAGIQVKL